MKHTPSLDSIKARLRARIAHLKRRQAPGWIGYGTGEASLTDPAYSRVTNPERFHSLHTAMLAIIDRLESDFEVECAEGFGFDEKLARGLDLAPCGCETYPERPCRRAYLGRVYCISGSSDPVWALVHRAFPGLWLRRLR